MKLFHVILALFLTVANGYSCRFGRGTCMASCIAQNCATGYCTSIPSGTCVCSRCGIGPIYPRLYPNH